MRGFTLVELMTVVIIVGIVITVLIVGVFGGMHKDFSVGINGVVEMRCIGGRQFTIDQNGTTRQVLDSEGRAAQC